MSDDRYLSELFRGADGPPTSAIDASEVVRRSRRRRLPRQVGAGSLLSLTAVGLGVAGISGLSSSQIAGTTMSDSAETESSGSADQSDSSGSAEQSDPSSSQSGRAPAENLNLCGGAPAEIAPSASGLTISVTFPDAPVGTDPVQGTATLTNTGSSTVVGHSAASPTITLSRDGTVVWHSNGPTILLATDVNLEPGESFSYPATFTPVICSLEDDLAEGFRDGLPVAPAGQYQVSAAIDVFTNATVDTVTGPAVTVTLN